MATRKVIAKQINGTILRSIPNKGEVSFGQIVQNVMNDPPPIHKDAVWAIGIACLTSAQLQKNRRKGKLRSIRRGWWKREKNVTKPEVSANENSRVRHGASTILNVADEIVAKKDVMPGLENDIADDLRAFSELALYMRGRMDEEE